MKTVFSTLVLVCLLVATLGISPVSAARLEYSGYPTISILSVVADQSVTIRAHNLPPSDTFSVMMNYMGTKGKNGTVVGSFNSGSGGSQDLTYIIPDSLKGQKQIAIRIQSTSGSGYYAYNWFYNKSGGAKPPSGSTGSTGYTGYPTFSIKSVVRNSTVTIVTSNLPANDTFAVKMNYMGTRGVNGYQVATLATGSGGTQTLTYNIPAELYGQRQIAIRLESTSGSGYYAYNWFYNNTYP
jgi:hypothetical protein